jgi:5-methyltetrahydropteroyltriglutamate--homocysteine methyltransferase
MMKTYAYGFPRLGKNRRYKKVIESYWKQQINKKEEATTLDRLQEEMISTYEKSVDLYPLGEMTRYDLMLDTSIMVGLYHPSDTDQYYELCRGGDALEMSKWFNTNYHYLIPDLSSWENPRFSLNWNKPYEYRKKFTKGVPHLIGPFTFLKLSKGIMAEKFEPFLMSLSEVYQEILKDLPEAHIEEPAFVLDVKPEDIKGIKEAYRKMGRSGCSIHLFTYYDSVDFLEDLYELPVRSIGLDFVHGRENLMQIRKKGFPDGKILIAGLIDSRNVWKADLAKAAALLHELSQHAKDLYLSNAAPLYHVPITVREELLDEKLLGQLSFAEEKLEELKRLALLFERKESIEELPPFDLGFNEEVREKVRTLTEKDFLRSLPYAKRKPLQEKNLNLPLFPTTTIGSYPQTPEVRKRRADFASGRITEEEYSDFIKGKISEVIQRQEELGLDVLTHGEFERSDMVEFFARKLDGIATTQNGWIISYGTRVYRPPIIYGDISRKDPMTVREISYAQSLTPRPVKGMLTGPVTIIAWSYTREDIPTSEVAYQLALSLREEIKDYEKAGIKIVQLDEPAFRERVPIKRREWEAYFDWSLKAFHLATASARPETQIQTHMCYSEFGEIMDRIVQMDFDVLLIEAARSHGDILDSFERINFDRMIGLGVWDVHSPVVHTAEEMKKVIERALRIIPKENFWINPDCGLKTRGWEETLASLKNMVNLAKELQLEDQQP